MTLESNRTSSSEFSSSLESSLPPSLPSLLSSSSPSMLSSSASLKPWRTHNTRKGNACSSPGHATHSVLTLFTHAESSAPPGLCRRHAGGADAPPQGRIAEGLSAAVQTVSHSPGCPTQPLRRE
jgi:hypothetical protein